MALTSSSTFADAMAQLNDNLEWDVVPAQRRPALQAVRWLLANRAQASSGSGTALSFTDLSAIEKRLTQVLDTNRRHFVQGRVL